MLLTAAIPTLTMLMANATYDIPAIRTTLTEVFTNKTPTDAYRGAGRPEATYFVERAMDMLARELKMDPAEVRRKNFIAAEQVPVRDADGRRLRLGRLRGGARPGARDRRLDAAEGGARCRPRRGTARRPRPGDVRRGLRHRTRRRRCRPAAGSTRRSPSSATAGSPPPPAPRRTARATRRRSRRCWPISSACRSSTSRSFTATPAIVKQGIGTFGSRSQAVGGTALHLAGGKVKVKMAKFAAALLEAHEDDLVFENGTIAVKGSPASAKKFADVAALRLRAGPAPRGSRAGPERRGVLRADATTPTRSAATSRCSRSIARRASRSC